MKRALRASRLLALAALVGCGARSGLFEDRRDATAAGVVGGAGGTGGVSGTGGTGGAGGAGGTTIGCTEGDTVPCGSDVGECKKGLRTCHEGVLGPCEGDVGPSPELCNGLDDDCNGQVDEGFGLGAACDGPDTDLCLDDKMTCAGCSVGPNNLETCNGVDDNCNGVIDADCDMGDCKPTLIVTGSTPSSPNCVDFPVMAGSTGAIEYPCTGGPVTAQLGAIAFSGSVQNGFVSLDGTAIVLGPDGCKWKTSHHIDGTVSSGKLSYSYAEQVVSGFNCWLPCTETGTVQIQWVPAP